MRLILTGAEFQQEVHRNVTSATDTLHNLQDAHLSDSLSKGARFWHALMLAFASAALAGTGTAQSDQYHNLDGQIVALEHQGQNFTAQEVAPSSQFSMQAAKFGPVTQPSTFSDGLPVGNWIMPDHQPEFSTGLADGHWSMSDPSLAVGNLSMLDHQSEFATGITASNDFAPQSEAKALLEKGMSYLKSADLPEDVRRQFDPSWIPDVVSTWDDADTWEERLVDKMLALEPGVNVDDHDGTPIGKGDTIGLVGAQVQMDTEGLDQLPEDFQSGLFSHCSGACAEWPAAIRVSHTNAADIDLMRIALKFDAGRLGVVDLHFTETLQTFPIADRAQLEAFTYSVEHGTLWALARYPYDMAKMGYNAYQAKNKWGSRAKLHGPTGKEYYSLTPYQIGGESGKAASAMKWRLKPKQQTPYPTIPEGATMEQVKQNMRTNFAEVVSSEGDVGFDLEVQIATDPLKHPVNDASVEWDAPWVKMGSVRIPRQQFPSDDLAKLDPGDAIGDGLWQKGHKHHKFNSKELLFSPGSTPHKPLGDINAFRAHLYPSYDEAFQKHMLGKEGGKPATCPFAKIMKWLR